MKVKLFFISTLLLLQGNFLFPQCISIELSIIWEKEYDIIKKDSIVCIPKLNIIYRNNCNTNYYFSKIYRDSLPCFTCLISYYPSEEKQDCYKAISYNTKKYANQNFNVTIGTSLYYSSFWYAYKDTINAKKSPQSEYVNCSLEALYHCIRYDYNLDFFWNYLHILSERGQPIKDRFESSDILPEKILTTIKDQFVFLKSRETLTDSYNLLGFQIIEGCFTFLIEQDDIKNYVLTNQYDSKMKKNVEHKLELPAVVGEYQLYSGGFNTNKVTVCFGEK